VNQIKGILLAFVLLSGAISAPIPSFAQSTDDNESFSYIYEILRQLFSSGDIEIITDGSSIQDFNKATIILTSSTTTTDPTSKVVICHIPPGNPSKAHTISVSSSALSAHLAHGDYEGACTSPSDPIDDEFEHDEFEIEIEVEIEDGIAEIKVEFGDEELEFEMEWVDKQTTIDEISLRTGLSLDQIEAFISFEFEDDEFEYDDILEFDDDILVITSSNTAVVELHNKILDLQSDPSINFEDLVSDVLSVSTLLNYLVDADKQDLKEFKKLFHDYEKIVKKVVKNDKSQKKIIKFYLKSVEKDFKALKHKDKKEKNELEYKEKSDREAEKQQRESDREAKEQQRESDREAEEQQRESDREAENKEIIIYGNGEQTRDFISINDVVESFDCAIKSKTNGTYNIASGISVSINELAQIMFDIFRKKLRIKFQEEYKGDIKNSVADILLAKNELNFSVKRILKEELTKI